MAGNGTAASSQPLIPIFRGENYQFWSLKMKTLFKSQELWDVVETRVPEGNANQLREHQKRDSKALFMIQQALHDDIFPRISAAETSKKAWEILKQEYFGDDKISLHPILDETTYHLEGIEEYEVGWNEMVETYQLDGNKHIDTVLDLSSSLE